MSLIGLLLRGFGGSSNFSETTTGTLEHSPAEIVQQLLLDRGLATDPELGLAWPAFVSKLPSRPDSAIACVDVAGKGHGRLQPSGKVPSHYGVQVLLRSPDASPGFVKLRNIAVSLTQQLVRQTVTVDSTPYIVQAIVQLSEVLALGRESPFSGNEGETSDCQLNSISLLISVKQVLE